MRLSAAKRQALHALWRRSDKRYWTSGEAFFNANSANALARDGLADRSTDKCGPVFRLTKEGRALGDDLFAKRGAGLSEAPKDLDK